MESPLKFLVVDHFFGQDIEALRFASPACELLVVSPDLLGAVARRIFPASVFLAEGGGEIFGRPELAEARRRYDAQASEILESLYCEFPFDAVILPSDSIVYLRAWIPAAHRMGLPVVVLNKETTISPHTLTVESRVIGEFLPFISDLLLVCSENNRQYWLNAGADPRRIFVTGQPRFDLYHQPARWKTLESQGVPVHAGVPNLLFFSYDLSAYSTEGSSAPTWARLRSETEEVLLDLARDGRLNLLVKPHPQQQGIEDAEEQLRSRAGSSWGKLVHWLPGGLDTRQLIVHVDCVVGFQTTAMFEAMAAGKKVIYTHWTEPVARLGTAVIPFSEMGDALLLARSPEELRSHVLSDPGDWLTEERKCARSREIQRQLGPFDGHASKRCLRKIEDYVAGFAEQAGEPARAYRSSLDARAPAHCRRAMRSARIASSFWGSIGLLLPILLPPWMAGRRLLGMTGPTISPRTVAARVRSADERTARCRAMLRRSTGGDGAGSPS
jgi:hypothetical protein